jgi:Rho-binding antiterminator
MSSYQSPGCHFIDQIEAAATLRQSCQITYRDETGQPHQTQTKIIDVFTTDGADWCKLEDATVIRLDRIHQFHPIQN